MGTKKTAIHVSSGKWISLLAVVAIVLLGLVAFMWHPAFSFADDAASASSSGAAAAAAGSSQADAAQSASAGTGASVSADASSGDGKVISTEPKKPMLPTGLKAGWNKKAGVWYLGNKKGNALTGWQKVKGYWYYLDPETGKMRTGWLQDGGKKYYLANSGAMVTGWKKLKGTWYYFNGSGAMATGWKKLKGYWYYLDKTTGAMQTGWLEDGKTWYYLYGSGAMASNAYIGKYYVAKSGAWKADPWQKKANALSSSSSYVVIVDTSMNWTLVYKGAKGNRVLVKSMQCTTGAPATPTVKGEFSVLDRKPSFGDGSYVVWNATRFYGGYFFHSVLYYPGSKSKIKDGRLGMRLSHGCVRLSYANSQWIYKNIPNGTKVYVY